LAGVTVLGNSALSESTVMIDGAAQVHQQMQQEDQIPSSLAPAQQQQNENGMEDDAGDDNDF